METENSTAKKWSFRTKLVAIGVALVVLVALVVAIYFIVQDSTAVSSSPTQLGTSLNPAKSCLHLRNNSVSESGFYFIKTEDVSFQVYCDMTTSGGGWTLVANVHQFDNVGQCTSQNMWYGKVNSDDSRNWENRNIFGQLFNATSSDYKNPAYFSLKASNIMIRHLANNYSVLGSEEQTKLQYHTENDFLDESGGNLYEAFKQFYPLTPTSAEEQITTEPSVLQQMLDALEAKASDILNVVIPPLYEYVYDDLNPDRLTNGGNNLFDPYGMKVSIKGSNCSVNGIHYGESYPQCGNLTSRRTYPFFALLHTSAFDQQYLFTIESNRSIQGRVFRSFNKHIASHSPSGSFEMIYQANCDLNNEIPSYCDVTFTVYSYSVWNSRKLSEYGYRSTHTNAVYGYTLIARESGLEEIDLPLAEVASRILNVLEKFSAIDVEAMINALVENSNQIINITQPPPYRYQYEDGNPDQDRLSDDKSLFNPYGMKVTAYTPNGNAQPIEYGKSYNQDLTEISSRRSYPFFALMKLNNPSLHQAAAFQVTGGRPEESQSAIRRRTSGGISIGNFSLSYNAKCSYSLIEPSICDVIFGISNQQQWKSQFLSFSNQSTFLIRNRNVSDYDFYRIFQQSRATNAIFGYTLLSRHPGNIRYNFPFEVIMKSILSVFTNFFSIGLPCSNPNQNLVAPVKFSVGNTRLLQRQIPRRFQPYTSLGFLQLRAATFDGDFYALCPGLILESCEPSFVCIGEVRKTNEGMCNTYLEWPFNGTSYTEPRRPYFPFPGISVPSISDNIMIFYR